MYVGVGGGAGPVRPLPAERQRPHGRGRRHVHDLTKPSRTRRATRAYGFCDPQCSYDNYVYVPPGADADTVYLSGSNQYNENDYVTGRSNGRAVLVSTNAGVHFTDLTDDTSDQNYPFELHPDHHALVTNPTQLEAVLRRR